MENQSNPAQVQQDFKPGISTKLKSFFIQSKRVWHILRKPDNEEFKSIAKISALGILAVGLLGFIIANIITLL